MKSQVAVAVLGGGALMIVLGAGVVVGTLTADDADEVARLEESLAAIEGRIDGIERQAARLRAERNALEARLAAGRLPPVCPKPFVSTGSLLPSFTTEYPCGWHVVALPEGADTERSGLLRAGTLLARLPLSLTPSERALADIELVDWSDDPGAEGDALPTLQQWADDERARFTAEPSERSFEGGDAVTVIRLEGPQTIADRETVVVVELWEYADPFTGARHVIRVFAAEPGPDARRAVDRLARSFSVVRR